MANRVNWTKSVKKLEEIGEKRWGNEKEYQEYKKNTSKFFPKFF